MITVFIAVILFIAVLAWACANAHIVRSGIPDGRIILRDADRRRPLSRPLVSRRCGVTGKPDYLADTADGLIPVEIKSRPRPTTGPRVADLMQLLHIAFSSKMSSGRARRTGSSHMRIGTSSSHTHRSSAKPF